jgi:sugar/nucleoside kinase (ribokinase family)
MNDNRAGRPFDVIVVGELNVDLIFDGLDGKLPERGKEILAREMTLTLGSSSAIFASNLSALGTSVSFTGRVGKDNFADLVLGSLKLKGVDISGIIISGKDATGITVACSYGEERAMVTHAGAMEQLVLEDISRERLEQGKHLHLSSAFLQKGLKPRLVDLFRMAREAGMTTSFDPQWDPDERWDLDLGEFLPHVDLFLPNLEEIKHLTRTGSLEEALVAVKDLTRVTVVKDGSRGAYLQSAGQRMHQPVFMNRQVADTIGAGDSFNAGFVSGFVKGESLNACLRFGALAGAINTCRPGGTAAFADKETIREIARERFNEEIS